MICAQPAYSDSVGDNYAPLYKTLKASTTYLGIRHPVKNIARLSHQG